MARPENKFLYRCTKDSCREQVLIAAKTPDDVRTCCPNCQCPLELVRGPIDEKIPENFRKPVKADGTKLPEINTETNELIRTRHTTHGEYTDNAEISQGLKEVLRTRFEYYKLFPFQKESLDMIFGKIGRILAGDPGYAEHWLDIAGYAMLVKDRLTEDNVRVTIPESSE